MAQPEFPCCFLAGILNLYRGNRSFGINLLDVSRAGRQRNRQFGWVTGILHDRLGTRLRRCRHAIFHFRQGTRQQRQGCQLDLGSEILLGQIVDVRPSHFKRGVCELYRRCRKVPAFRCSPDLTRVVQSGPAHRGTQLDQRSDPNLADMRPIGGITPIRFECPHYRRDRAAV